MLVYPIFYCVRHHAELVLKVVLPKAWKLFKVRSPHENQGLSEPRLVELTHSVWQIWSALHEICERTDPRLCALTAALQPFVKDIEVIDSSGQVFRYASHAETGARHLADYSHIHLQTLADGHAEMCELLSELEQRVGSLTCEYQTGTFTKRLHRDQLEEIALMLPIRSQWGSAEFAEVRERVRITYGLSSKDFQKACSLIESTRHLARHIGAAKPIDGVPGDLFMRLQVASKSRMVSTHQLDIRERAIVLGLLEVGRGVAYPEEFDEFVNRATDEAHAILNPSELETSDLARRIAARPEFVHRGLRLLGQVDLIPDFRRAFEDEIIKREALRFGNVEIKEEEE